MEFKELLKEVDMNGAQVARKIGVTTSAVNAWALGKARPNCDKWQDIAKAMNVPVERVMECFVKKGA